jgi:hypothetical protein
VEKDQPTYPDRTSNLIHDLPAARPRGVTVEGSTKPLLPNPLAWACYQAWRSFGPIAQGRAKRPRTSYHSPLSRSCKRPVARHKRSISMPRLAFARLVRPRCQFHRVPSIPFLLAGLIELTLPWKVSRRSPSHHWRRRSAHLCFEAHGVAVFRRSCGKLGHSAVYLSCRLRSDRNLLGYRGREPIWPIIG